MCIRDSPYTYGLLKSIPKLSLAGLPESMPGSQPQPGNIGNGCSFYDRCNFSNEKCKVNVPKLEYLSEMDTSVRCFNHSELITKTSEQKTKNHSQKEITIDEILDLKDVSISYAKQGIIDQFLNKVTDTNPTVKDINTVSYTHLTLPTILLV